MEKIDNTAGTENRSGKPEPPRGKQGERNPGASIQQKLRNHAKARGEDMVLVLARYIIERFLYRLSQSPYHDRFVLRGATLFSVWLDDPSPDGGAAPSQVSTHRPTRDVDLLAHGDNSTATMTTVFGEICATPVSEDGVSFLLDTLKIEERSEARAYPGLHIEVTAALGSARPRLEVDVAFGEAVTPAPSGSGGAHFALPATATPAGLSPRNGDGGEDGGDGGAWHQQHPYQRLLRSVVLIPDFPHRRSYPDRRAFSHVHTAWDILPTRRGANGPDRTLRR